MEPYMELAMEVREAVLVDLEVMEVLTVALEEPAMEQEVMDTLVTVS